jgi:hypothetical protein
MSRKNWSRLLVIPFLAVFMASMLFTIPVRADDATPPPANPPASTGSGAVTDQSSAPASPSASSGSGNASDPTSAPAEPAADNSDTTKPTSAPANADTTNPTSAPAAASTDVASTDPSATPAAPTATDPGTTAVNPSPSPDISSADTNGSTSQALSQVPTGTDVVVVDNAGKSVPLASQEAAKIIATGDPVWCPTGVLPGSVKCSSAFTTFTGNTASSDAGLISVLTGKTVSGTIWISSSYNSSLENDPTVTLNGLSLGSTANYALILKGGWSGTLGDGTTNPAAPSTFTVPLSIINWNADVTLSDIQIMSVTTGDGLTVSTTKNIALTRVRSTGSTTGKGAVLNNSGGTTGTVTITSSQFENNFLDGLDVISKGAITLNSVTANGNGSGVSGVGANLNNSGGTGAVAISSSQFNTNNVNGLVVTSKGAITLNTVTANLNVTGYGANLDNSGGTAPVTITSITSNQFNTNQLDGLDILSKGAITLSSLTAAGNIAGIGANLNNPTSLGTVTITSGTFNTNHLDGLDVINKGAITLNSVAANGNTTGDGTKLDNTSGTGTVSITSGTFNVNGLHGLEVNSNGAITTKTLTANGNIAGAGVSLINSVSSSAQPVTVAGTNTFTGNFLDGLNVESNGLITVNSVTATGNDTSNQAPGPFGVFLTNSINAGFSSGISMTGTALLPNVISGNYYDGLYVFSNGPISLNYIQANNNTHGVGAFISNNTASGPQPVTISGINQFNTNGLGGLIVYSNGIITTNNLTADGNGSLTTDSTGNGVYLDNCNYNTTNCVGFARAISVLGNNQFDGNFNDGLNVQSLGGVITVNNIEANGNGTVSLNGVGAYLANDNSTLQSAVNITSNNVNGNVFNGNFDSGLEVFSNGAIMANHVTADSTVNTTANGFGAYLDNCDSLSSSCQSPAAQPVTLTGLNEFSNNPSNGLVIESRGVITLNNITADTNGNTSANFGVGALLQNNFNNSTSGVTLAGTNVFNGNYGTYISPVSPYTVYLYGGLAVLSKGVIGASNLTANSNTHGDGVYLNNSYAGVSRSVTLTGINTFNTNGYNGLHIESFGNIIASNLNATGNGNGTFGINGSGAFLKNNFFVSPVLSTGTVTLTGTNIFTGNEDYGLEVASNGAITISNLTADSTVKNDGAYLINTSAPGAQPVTLTGSNIFTDNQNYGLQIFTNGAITISNLTADSTVTNDGAFLDNTTAVGAQPVTLTGSNAFNYNHFYGLNINSNGAITVSSLTAVGNTTGYGAWLENDIPGFASNVTLSGSDLFIDNNLGGLVVSSLGAISMNTTSLTATGNGAGGDPLSGSDNGVYLINYLALKPMPITVKGMNFFDNNHGIGLLLYSKGAITAGNLTSSNNQNGYGVQLYNNVGGAAGNVTLTGNNVFYGNGKDGLTVSSVGAITISNIVANANGQLGGPHLFYGIDLTNTSAVNLGVIISGTNILNENYSGGMRVRTNGTITVNNVTAMGNTGNGATLDNSTGLPTVGVTFTGANFFEDNIGGDGLNITSHGKVTLTKITADGNSLDGLDVTTPLTLTLTCGSYTNNTLYGINLNTNGITTIIGAVLSGNHLGDSVHQTGTATPVIVRTCTLP